MYVAFAISLGAVASTIFIAKFETSLAIHNPAKIVLVQKIFVPILVVVACVLYIDLGFTIDVMHYLTNIGPATSLLNGGVPFVEIFPQYGLGPVVMTALGMILTQNHFVGANIVVQIFNLGFIALNLLAASRLTTCRISVVLLGIVVLTLMYGIWGGAYQGNINAAPSSLGIRYFWPAAMVLAIMSLKADRMYDYKTTSIAAAATIWSAEAMIFTSGIQLAFIALSRCMERQYTLFVRDLFIAIIPNIFILCLGGLTLYLWAQTTPDYLLYLYFLLVYSPLKDLWGISSSGGFWGWWLFVLAPVFIISLVFCGIIKGVQPASISYFKRLIREWFPLVLLMACCAILSWTKCRFYP